MTRFHRWSMAALCALLLGACGSEGSPEPVRPNVQLLLSTERGMHSLVFDSGHAYLSLFNGPDAATAVLRGPRHIVPNAPFQPVALEPCALGPAGAEPLRAPGLVRLQETVFLFQPWFGQGEHALCALSQSGMRFMPRDQGLQVCNALFCETLWMTSIEHSGGLFLSNAGAGVNVLVSANGGRDWRALIGNLESRLCHHPAFLVLGDRLLSGGECPLDFAYLRAFRLDTLLPLPLVHPELNNRQVQFIAATPDRRSVFAGLEGALLRSLDAGRSFEYVIFYPLEGTRFPHISHFLALRNDPKVLLVAGFDQASGKPYLAWSADAGTSWSELSSLLPGFDQRTSQDVAQVTSLSQDQAGRILLTVNERAQAQGRLLLLRLPLGLPPGR